MQTTKLDSVVHRRGGRAHYDFHVRDKHDGIRDDDSSNGQHRRFEKNKKNEEKEVRGTLAPPSGVDMPSAALS